MKPQPISINIPQPCHENPASMQKNEQGKFCSACQKNVRDFSQMTDNEILEILSTESGSGCGTFRAGQLNRLMVQTQLKGNNTRLNTIMAGLLLAAGAGTVSAQTTAPGSIPFPVPDTVIAPVDATKPVTTGSTPSVFQGQVFDASSGDSLPFVFVFLKGTKCQTTTDANGNFKLVIPDSLMQDTMVFVISSVAYEKQEVIISRSELNANTQVRLYRMDMMIDGLYIIERPEPEPVKKKKK